MAKIIRLGRSHDPRTGKVDRGLTIEEKCVRLVLDEHLADDALLEMEERDIRHQRNVLKSTRSPVPSKT